MTPIDWIRNGLAALRPRRWGDDCPGGTPVPEAARCAALDCDSVSLLGLSPGGRGRVTCLAEPDGPGAAKLAALGVLPGIEVAVVQRWPAWVLRLGYAEIAVDEELAALVRVRVEPAGIAPVNQPGLRGDRRP